MVDLNSRGTAPRLRLGVSRCLLGERVRYDGGEKRNHLVADVFAQGVEYVPICPELEIGLGVPRPPLQLIGSTTAAQLRGVQNINVDYTRSMLQFGRAAAQQLRDVHGYIFKARSPSCGVHDTPIYDATRDVVGYGAGLFARAVATQFPWMPIEDENALSRADARSRFFEHAFAYRRWLDVVSVSPRMPAVREFYVSHKYSLLAHDQRCYRALGRWLAQSRAENFDAVKFGERFFAAMRRPATRANHVNVHEHILGYFKKAATNADRDNVRVAIAMYRDEKIQLPEVIDALRALNAKYPHAYLSKQTYLYPDPHETLLRFSATEGRSNATGS